VALAQDAGLFDKLDKNQDGQIAADEVEGQGKGLFERLLRTSDKDKDGKLSKAEFAEGVKQRANEAPAEDRPADGLPRPVNAQEVFARMDKNGDGKISREEAPDRLAQNFDRADANGSGFIEKEELARLGPQFLQRPAAAPANRSNPSPRPEHLMGAMVLRALDADGNAELSAEEIAGAAKVLAKFDKDGDGKITAEELQAQVPRGDRANASDVNSILAEKNAAVLRKEYEDAMAVSRKNPGSITEQELERLKAAAEAAERAAANARRPDAQPAGDEPPLLRRLREFDKNGDGKISKNDVPEGLQRIFERLDANSDGTLEDGEIRKALEARRDRN
jgi:collagen type III alpha